MGSFGFLLVIITVSSLVPLASSEKEVDPCVAKCIETAEDNFEIAQNTTDQAALSNLSLEFKKCLFDCPPSEYRNESIYIGISPTLLAIANGIESLNGLQRDCSNETDQSNSTVDVFGEFLFNCSSGKFKNASEVADAVNPTTTRYQLSYICKYTKCAIVQYITQDLQATCNGTANFVEFVEFGTKVLRAQFVPYLYQYQQFKTGNGTFDVDFFPCRCRWFFEFM